MLCNALYVYDDWGVGKESLRQTLRTLGLFSDQKIKTLNSDDVQKGTWMHDAALFVLPGGADLPYVKKLHGQGNQIIKRYVENGGAFLGICAGSYYASSYVVFDPGGRLEVVGPRELSFFKGRAVGPVFGPYDNQTMKSCLSVKIHTPFHDVPEADIFYNGGGFFKNAHQCSSTRVIATYENHWPAIIAMNYGKGRVVLSGVHFEYDPFFLDTENPYFLNIIQSLRNADPFRKRVIKHIMTLLRIKSSEISRC